MAPKLFLKVRRASSKSGWDGEPGVMDPHDPGMRLEAPGQLGRGGAGALGAQAERGQAAQGQPALERVARLAEGGGDVPDAVDLVARADHGSRGQVAVAADQLGHRMHDECRPQLDRPAEERGEGVVDEKRNSGLAAHPGDRLEIRRRGATDWRSSRRGSAGSAG